MRFGLTLTAIVAAAVGGVSTSNAAPVTFTAVGTYDDTFNTNAVDSTAPGSIGFSGFTSGVSTAFASGFGGVVQFENTTNPLPAAPQRLADGSANGFNISYAGGTKTLPVSANTTLRVTNFASANQLSGVYNLDTAGANDINVAGANTFTFTFGAITGGAANEAVTSVALTANSRNNAAGTVTMVASYYNPSTTATSTETLTDSILGGASDRSFDDTFYGFAAPAGSYITSLQVTRTAVIPFDDLGVVTGVVVPEPTSLGLIGLGAVALLRRKR